MTCCLGMQTFSFSRKNMNADLLLVWRISGLIVTCFKKIEKYSREMNIAELLKTSVKRILRTHV